MSSTRQTDAQAVAAARAGEAAAFARLYDAYAAPIYSHLRRLVGDESLAEDLAHDAFVRAHRHLASLRNPEAVRPWLYRIATNLALNALRRESRTRPLEEAPGSTMGVDDIARRELVEQVLGRLPAEQRALLLLHLRQGFGLEEVARLLGVSYAAAKQRAYRARQAFIREYRRLEGPA